MRDNVAELEAQPSPGPIELILPRLATGKTILIRRSERVILELLPVPPGKFEMGIERVEVTISRPFWLTERQFTQNQRETLMGIGPEGNISWNDCMECIA